MEHSLEGNRPCTSSPGNEPTGVENNDVQVITMHNDTASDEPIRVEDDDVQDITTHNNSTSDRPTGNEDSNAQDTTTNNRDLSVPVTDALLSKRAESIQAEPKKGSATPSQNTKETASTLDLFISIIKNWWLEFGCLVVSVLALVAAVITLSTHQGRPLPEWPYSISINSLISLYIIIVKASMLVVIAEGLSQLKWTWYEKTHVLGALHHWDRASRGPLGAVQLLWALRGRNPVATVGAIIVIVALILDPMAQALVRYYSCSVEHPSISADVPVSNGFSEMGPHIGAGIGSLPYSFQSSINAGLFNPESVKISFACPTGNCTFESTYHTLAYCSKCTDVSEDLTTTCHDVPLTEKLPRSSDNITQPECLTGLPEGHQNSAVQGTIEYLTAYSTQDSFILVASNLTSVYTQTGGNCTTEADNSTASWSCSGSGAAECKLQPCIRSYKASVHDNILRENLIETWQNWMFSDRSGMSRDAVNVACVSNQTRQDLEHLGYVLNSSFIAYRGDGYLQNGTAFNATAESYPNVTVPNDCLYRFYEPTIMSIETFLVGFFNGTVSTNLGLNYAYNTEGSVQLNRFYNSANMSFQHVDEKLKDLADSMTAYIRQSKYSQNDIGTAHNVFPSQDTASVKGRVFDTDTCVDVQWKFVALPITLVSLSAMFLFAMIFQTMRKGRSPAWKSSSLALLFSGLDVEARQRQGVLEQLDDMTSAAKNMKVRLRKTDAGWHFAEND